MPRFQIPSVPEFPRFTGSRTDRTFLPYSFDINYKARLTLFYILFRRPELKIIWLKIIYPLRPNKCDLKRLFSKKDLSENFCMVTKRLLKNTPIFDLKIIEKGSTIDICQYFQRVSVDNSKLNECHEKFSLLQEANQIYFKLLKNCLKLLEKWTGCTIFLIRNQKSDLVLKVPKIFLFCFGFF